MQMIRHHLHFRYPGMWIVLGYGFEAFLNDLASFVQFHPGMSTCAYDAPEYFAPLLRAEGHKVGALGVVSVG
jgi:hypothetical protein